MISWNCSKWFNFDDKTKFLRVSKIANVQWEVSFIVLFLIGLPIALAVGLMWNRNKFQKFPPNSTNYITSSRPILEPYYVKLFRADKVNLLFDLSDRAKHTLFIYIQRHRQHELNRGWERRLNVWCGKVSVTKKTILLFVECFCWRWHGSGVKVFVYRIFS